MYLLKYLADVMKYSNSALTYLPASAAIKCQDVRSKKFCWLRNRLLTSVRNTELSLRRELKTYFAELIYVIRHARDGLRL